MKYTTTVATIVIAIVLIGSSVRTQKAPPPPEAAGLEAEKNSLQMRVDQIRAEMDELMAKQAELSPAIKQQMGRLQEELAVASKELAEKVRRETSLADRAFKLYLEPGTPIKYRGVQGWWNAVDQYSRLTDDPTSMGVAAVLQASELLKPRGPQAQIDYFETLLPQVKSETVKRAIHLQLIEAYKQANKSDKALEELQTLITAAPKVK